MAAEEIATATDGDSQREHWALVLHNQRQTMLPTILLGALYAAFFSHYAAAPLTWAWWLALTASVAARAWFCREAMAEQLRHARALRAVFYVSLAATGILWGLAPIVVYRPGEDLMLFTALVLATGVGIAAFSVYVMNLYAVAVLVLPIAALSFGLLAARGQPADYAAGAVLLALYAYQAALTVHVRRVLARQIRLRIENSLLAAQLSARAEKTSAELERRMDMERHLRASRDRAERMSATDALTEIANRRYFDKRLKSETSRAFRERTPLSLIICDLDFFKQYNDRYGHQQGDECLRAFARVLESYCRRGGDLAARIGGEEFALLLPATDHAAALKLAEQARAAFEALGIRHEGSKPYGIASASFGVSTLVPDGLGADETLMRNADQALYRAKAQGRNRVAGDSEREAVATAME